MGAHYFAYGSNLVIARMRERVPSARAVAVGSVEGFRLALDKRGGDGSGKANLARAEGSRVWGAVYAIDEAHWPALDACEPGYERIRVAVATAEGPLAAETYVARVLTDDPVPFAWYKRLLVEGAREHGLPEAWQELLAKLPERPDC